MFKVYSLSLTVGLLLFGDLIANEVLDEHTTIPSPFDRLLPLHHALGQPQPGEWLYAHKELGQSYREYVAGRPVRPTGRRRVIFVQPLGDFTDPQRKIVQLTAEYLGIYFGLPVKTQKDLPLTIIPTEARRTHPTWGDKQILSTYILSEVLRPRLPRNASALIAFTATDLWPGKDWNFLFGQASLRDRVGVWSIYRNGDPAAGDEAFRLCLRRTIKIASHETGHMFSMAHCTLYRCNMGGTNSRNESDSQPLALCPHCLAKLCYCTGVDPARRFEALIRFYKTHGLAPEQESAQKLVNAIK